MPNEPEEGAKPAPDKPADDNERVTIQTQDVGDLDSPEDELEPDEEAKP